MKYLTKIIVFIGIIVALIGVDIVSKSIFDYKSYTFLPGFISIYGYAHNSGAAFSILEDKLWIFIILAIIFIVGFFAYEIYTRRKVKHWSYYAGFILILAGTIGNLIDRIWFGYVRDFIKTEFMDFPVFNLADSFLTIGVIFFAIYLLFFYDEKTSKKGAN